jgi:hypothetical protein
VPLLIADTLSHMGSAPSAEGLSDAFATLAFFAKPDMLTLRIADLERHLARRTREQALVDLNTEEVTPALLQAALSVKRMAGQINVIVHAVGILVSLAYVLEPRERIESLSLGAGNTGRLHDLETDRQIGEFKFIEWRGGPEAIRQNSLFVDLFNLASAETTKRRVLYVVGKEMPMRFLRNRRALSSVLSKNQAVADRFRALHGDRFATVRDYYETVADRVEIVDLAEVVPFLRPEQMEEA